MTHPIGKETPRVQDETSPDIRPVTPDEAAHYQQHGWARLPGLLSPAAVARLRAMAEELMGADGQGNPVSPYQQPFFNPEVTAGMADPRLAPLLRGLGGNARALMQRRPEIGVRLFSDLFAAKLPAARATRHPGAGETFFHQDFMNWGVDRSGGLTFWIALADLVPESGTMAFLSGSHKAGVMGHYRSHGSGGLLADFPELAEKCPSSGALSYAAGDATVHNALTVHGAGANRTDAPRWAWIVVANPSDVRWNGAPPEAFDPAGMAHLQRLDEEARFPLIG